MQIVDSPPASQLIMKLLLLCALMAATATTALYFGTNSQAGNLHGEFQCLAQSIDVGAVRGGQTLQQFVPVVNKSNRRVVINQQLEACGCNKAPMEGSVIIQPEELRQLQVWLSIPEQMGDFQQAIQFHTSDKKNPRFEVLFRGTVVSIPEKTTPKSKLDFGASVLNQ